MSELLDYQGIADLLPERVPLLMLDRLELDLEGRCARGIKAVSMDEEFFQGHFPGAPIMPGILQIAAMSQAASALFQRMGAVPEAALFWLTHIRRLKFRKPVYPGDRLCVHVEAGNLDDSGLQIVRARTEVDGEVTCQGELGLRAKALDELAPAPSELAPPLTQFAGVSYGEPIDVNTIMATIPHRFPFLLVDRILYMNPDEMRIVVLKQITGNEPFFDGLPTHAVPAYIQAEIGAQAGCILALALPENRGKLGFFMSIDEGEFEEPVVPGDEVAIEVQVNGRGRFGKAEGSAWVGDRKVSRIVVKFAVVDPEQQA